MSANFAAVSAVDKAAESRYPGCIDEGWDIGRVPNGGYVLAIGARAMAESVGRPSLSVTAHFLARTEPGPRSVVVDLVRVGRRMATLAARLEQGAGEAIRVLGTFGESSGADPLLVEGAPPELPPYADCVVSPSCSPPSGPGDPPPKHLPAESGDSAGQRQDSAGTTPWLGWMSSGRAPAGTTPWLGWMSSGRAPAGTTPWLGWMQP